jgi:sugar phosphate isomerase/epimerase
MRIALSSDASMVLTARMKRDTLYILTAVTGLTLMATTVTGADQASRKTGIGPSFKGPIGLQLYSLREQFAKDVPGTLTQAQNFGFKYVELAGTYGQTPEKFKSMLAEHGLVPVAGHFGYEKFRDDAEGVAREAKALGLKYAGCAWIPHKDQFDEQECREAIAVFNRAGEALAKHGLKFFYHLHGYEFERYGSETLFDLMMAETKPKYVSYELDVLWAFFPGQDPAKLLDKHGNRWVLVHLKDLKKGVVTGSLSGHTDVANNVVMGAGQIDWLSFFRAAKKAGVKYYFIEDESPSVVEQIPQSLRYLEQVKF